MSGRRMIVDIHERIFADDVDWDELRVTGYDVTDIMLEVFGEDADGELIASFVSEPYEFGEIGQKLAQDPEIDFQAEISPDFDLLEFLQPGLTRHDSEEDMARAWARWRTSILAEGDPFAWKRRKWQGRTEELAAALKEDVGADVPTDLYLPFMKEAVRSPAMIGAFVEALRNWEGDPLVGLREIAAVVDGLQIGTKTS